MMSASLSGARAWLASAFAGFTPAVWLVVLLKALNGILIPATFKYADNILYSYAKPASIVCVCLASSFVSGMLPTPVFLGGVAMVLSSMALYNSKPKAIKQQ